tara:strand:+ start:2256 stop:2675 length:420 start_codon:yes stop_codon:yes gene_type:complete
MKLDSLRKIIREEVRAAVQDELKDILNEAVKFASKPETSGYKKADTKTRKWSVDPKLNETNKKNLTPITEMLNQTMNTMTKEDANNIMGGQPSTANRMASGMGMNSGPEPGIDISKLEFVGKAKDILDLANKKSSRQLT